MMSVSGLKSDFNFLSSQFCNVIRLTLPSNLLEFLVALKNLNVENWVIG